MSIATAAAIVAITIPFVLFAGALFWAEHQTRGLSHYRRLPEVVTRWPHGHSPFDIVRSAAWRCWPASPTRPMRTSTRLIA
jgi:hypothetical protein